MSVTHPVVPVVVIVNHQLTTTSLNVAAVFGKSHKNVLQAIENLDVPEEFRRLNFQPSNYLNEQGKSQPMYQITRDGFTVLVMGFTGPKAMKFKLAYIAAFNRMEAELLPGAEERPRLEPNANDPGQLAGNLMQALIASLSGSHNEKIDDLGVEVVTRLKDIADQIVELEQTADTFPQLECINENICDLREQLLAQLPQLSNPAELVTTLRSVALNLHEVAVQVSHIENRQLVQAERQDTALAAALPADVVDTIRQLMERLKHQADQQDTENFSFHERLRAMEMRSLGIGIDPAKNLPAATAGPWGYVEANVPASYRHKFYEFRASMAAGGDPLRHFMHECLVEDPTGQIEMRMLYPVYSAWSYANMTAPVGQQSFGKLVTQYAHDFTGAKTASKNYTPYLFGMRLRLPETGKTEKEVGDHE